jgi:TetR/AcrR family transcriptional repressor of bet genes
MGRPSNTDVRRQQIIDALRAEMSEVGFARASTRSVAERAGLAPGLVHYHFKDKEEILLALVEQMINDAEARFATLSIDAESPLEYLRAFVESRVGFGSERDAEKVRLWVNLIADAAGSENVRQRLSAWLAIEHKRLANWMRQAGSDAASAHAAFLNAAIFGAFSLHAVGVPNVPKGYALPQILHWLELVLPRS